MLPLALSADACSLSPGDERLAVTVEIVLGPDGAPRSASFYRSRIRSDQRLDYDELDEIFAGRATPPEAIAEPLGSPGARPRRSATRAPARRSRSPPTSPSSSSTPTATWSARDAVEQTEAHGLIEQLMICANERVAEHCERRKVPTLYRVHERPDPARVADLVAKLAALDVPTPPLPPRRRSISPSQAGELVAEASRLVAARGQAPRPRSGGVYITRAALAEARHVLRSQPRPRRPRQPRLRPLHLADPPLPRPDRPPGAALDAGRGRGRARAGRGRARPRAGARSASARRWRPSAMPTRSAPPSCSSASCSRPGSTGAFEGEVSGVIAPGAFVRFGGELGDVYEGFLPARRLRGERFDLDETETAIVGAAQRQGDPPRRPGHRARRRGRGGARAGRPGAGGRGGAAMAKQRQAKARLRRRRHATGAHRHKYELIERFEAGIELVGHRGQVAARGPDRRSATPTR